MVDGGGELAATAGSTATRINYDQPREGFKANGGFGPLIRVSCSIIEVTETSNWVLIVIA